MVNKYLYITDCEGPVTRNDNAYEIANHFLEEGGRLFSLLSVFDDYLGLFGNIENYRYGSTLRYVIPFLKAKGLTDEMLRNYSRNTIIVTPGIKQALNRIKNLMDVHMISTSYEHYIDEVIRYLQLEPKNVYCTRMSLDAYDLKPEEKHVIEEYMRKISTMAPITWNEKGELLPDAYKTVKLLREFFFDVLLRLPIGSFLETIIPIGGREKAKILMEIVERNNIPYENVIYVGDSITDTEAFQFLKDKGGLTISFNGNRYAISNAEYVIISETAEVLSEVAEKYRTYGKYGLELIKGDARTIVTKRRDSDIIDSSEKMRRALRGEAIGALG
ncbi:MAG: hypothetical protein N2513_01890 [Deltaproteobacteria bacterium]|nr:hypothetical protein [Deltaproteobacteria bacterium]